jgi:hypothetical protein
MEFVIEYRKISAARLRLDPCRPAELRWKVSRLGAIAPVVCQSDN